MKEAGAAFEILGLDGKPDGSVAIPSGWEGPVSSALIWQAVQNHLANQRQGTADTKTRGEVRGGGKKPWRQKHSGRARAGSSRSPIWRKGGVVFGPHPREYRSELPVRIRRKALGHSLRAKVKDGGIVVIDALDGKQTKTKQVAEFLDRLGVRKRAILVLDQPLPSLVRAARNLKGVRVLLARDLTCYDVLASEKLVVTVGSLQQMGSLFS